MESKSLVKESEETSIVLWIRLCRICNALSLQNPAYQKSPQVEQAIADLNSDLNSVEMPEDGLVKGTRLAQKRQSFLKEVGEKWVMFGFVIN